MAIRVYLGGSFDPIHHAHLQMAMHVYHTLKTHCPKDDIFVSLLPTAGNPFKHKPTSPHHRLAMLALAATDLPLCIDEHEIHQTPPVYTINTVKFLSKKYASDLLILILGQDSLATLPQWREGDAILNYVNIWAFTRQESPPLPNKILKLCTGFDEFLSKRQSIYLDNTKIPTMSSSQIRALLSQKDKSVEQFLPKSVVDYINQHALYG